MCILLKQPGQLDLHALTSSCPKLPSHVVSGMTSTQPKTETDRASLGERWKTLRKPPLKRYVLKF